ncbi:YcjF family protein [Methylovulum miyakonense]|uniref:YcjF family protein n=1 Tax=Methylovulum miyakonense TaxID=645578 RepID=UPI00036F2E31|nr:GTPase [Methylovulum miyakonense]
MNMIGNWTWKGLSDALFSPKASGVDPKINEVRQRLPIPVFWLLGKTQSGKTSLIRALTGNGAAEIGNGFQACTKRSQFYDFPSASHPMLRFLDTRGLGETAYDPGEDLAWCARQAHLLVVVLRALDMNQAGVVDSVLGIHKQHPDWPIIVVQTVLHEGYARGAGHLQPYPFQQSPFPPQVPHALAQALLHQRDWFKTVPAHFVPVDFTLPDDGFEPADYGLDALWDAVENALPIGVIGLLRGTEHHKALLDFHARQAHPHLIGYAVLNVGLGAVPLAGLPLVLAVQAKLFHSIASIYGLELTRRLYAEFTSLIGVSAGFGFLGRELLKLVPVYGAAVAGVYSGAMTYALGKAFCVYLYGVGRGALPDHALLKQAYDEAFAQARQFLNRRGD